MPKLQYDRLYNYSTCKQMYADRVESKFNSVDKTRNSKWNTLREVVVTSVNLFIPRKVRKKKEVDDK